jgi:hypothetical protein
VRELLGDAEHQLCSKRPRDLAIGECMEALYDIQDTLLLGGLEGDEAL